MLLRSMWMESPPSPTFTITLSDDAASGDSARADGTATARMAATSSRTVVFLMFMGLRF